MRKIKYTCKECGWHTSIWEEWEDLKPQRCMNRKCNTSFRVNPTSLIIEKPAKANVQQSVATVETKQHEKKEKHRHGKKFSKD